MAEREVTGRIISCDGCGKETFVTEGDDLPLGFHGRVTHIDAGGDYFEFYACSRRCVTRAFWNAQKAPR